jgi:hypothetical protein
MDIQTSNEILKAHGYRFAVDTSALTHDDPDDAPAIIVSPDGLWKVSRDTALSEIESGEWLNYYVQMFEREAEEKFQLDLRHQEAVEAMIQVIDTSTRYVELLVIVDYHAHRYTSYERPHAHTIDESKHWDGAAWSYQTTLDGYPVEEKRLLMRNSWTQMFLEEVDTPIGTIGVIHFKPHNYWWMET